jgi:hypothetical protein
MACQKLIFRRLLLLLARELVVKVELERWRQEKEKETRRDAIKGSITTLLKKSWRAHSPTLHAQGARDRSARSEAHWNTHLVEKFQITRDEYEG